MKPRVFLPSAAIVLALTGPATECETASGCEGGEQEGQLRHCDYDTVCEFALNECRKCLDW